MHSLHLEDVNESINTPSNTVANNNYYDNTTTISPRSSSSLGIVTMTDQRSLTFCDILSNSSSSLWIVTMTDRRLLNFCGINNSSQFTRFRFGSSTLLDKLWYTYSYIYKPTATKATFTFYKPILALLFISPVAADIDADANIIIFATSTIRNS